MNTQEVEITDDVVRAIRTICFYLKRTEGKVDDMTVGIKEELEKVSEWANDVIIDDDVPF